MDALTPFIALLVITLVGALASVIGADTRDGFDGTDRTLPVGSQGPKVAL
jgi:hypothetical protein